jgi:L-Ala-D/L-Glu epimerase
MGFRVNDKIALMSRSSFAVGRWPLAFDFRPSSPSFPSVPTRFLSIKAKEEIWPLKQPFRISRGSRTQARVVVVTVSDGKHIGRGESIPLARYNQSTASVLAQIESITGEKNLNRQGLQDLLPAGAARNALDCALWDLDAKTSGKRAWQLADIPIVPEVETSFTISLDTPEKMSAAASATAFAQGFGMPRILKLKLGGDDLDLSRIQAVCKTAPSARLLVDANESWSPPHYREIVPALNELRVELIEQPFPADADEVLETLDHPIPVCADESCHTTADLPRLTNRYEVINVKLDKTGGLSEALRLCSRAGESGLKQLIGCMVCTSLAIAPARLLASTVQWVDLDGPLLIAHDRPHGVAYQSGKIGMPSRELWG